MRLKITKSKNNVHYSIIKDYTPLNRKRTTKVYENLGNQKKVEERFGTINTLDKIKKYVNQLNDEDKDIIIKKEFNPNKKISPNLNNKFNVGIYL